MWNIAGPPGTQLALNYSYFSSEAFFDRLLIVRPQDCSLVTQLSGALARGSSLLVDTNAVALYFVADSSVTYQGFQLDWMFFTPPPTTAAAAIVTDNSLHWPAADVNSCIPVINSFLMLKDDPLPVKNCGLDVGEETGGSSISSFGPHPHPHHKSNSSDSKLCIWNIVAPRGSTVSLTVLTFNLSRRAGDRLFILEPKTCGPTTAG